MHAIGCYRPVPRFLMHFRRNPLKSQLVQEARRKRMGKQCFKMLKICSCQRWKTWLKHINKPRNLRIWNDHANTAWSDAAAASGSQTAMPEIQSGECQKPHSHSAIRALAGIASRKDLYIHPVLCKLKLPGSNLCHQTKSKEKIIKSKSSVNTGSSVKSRLPAASGSDSTAAFSTASSTGFSASSESTSTSTVTEATCTCLSGKNHNSQHCQLTTLPAAENIQRKNKYAPRNSFSLYIFS